MKLAILTVMKNEVDVLPSWLKCMEDAGADYFLFRDNESTDGSDKIVKNFPKTVYCERVPGRFETRMWDKLIEQAQKYLTVNDWFMICGPDEFPFFNIKEEIIKVGTVSSRYNAICTFYPTFFFTREMNERYNMDEEYRKKIDNFDTSNYSYFRNPSNYWPSIIKNIRVHGQRIQYTKSKQEPPPFRMIIYYNDLIVGHYRFRSPKQMQLRMFDRGKVNPMHKRKLSFTHYPTWNWKDYLISEKLLYPYSGLESMYGKMDLVRLDKLLIRNRKI